MKRQSFGGRLLCLLLTGCSGTPAAQPKQFTATFLDVFDTVTTIVGRADSQVKIDGQWKHIDPTPSQTHGIYSLMNDEQRLSTLSGRIWDTSLWPACE